MPTTSSRQVEQHPLKTPIAPPFKPLLMRHIANLNSALGAAGGLRSGIRKIANLLEDIVPIFVSCCKRD